MARGITALHALQRFQLENKKGAPKNLTKYCKPAEKNLICHQCCDSGMLIPDPIFPYRIQGRQDPGSRVDKIPNPELTRSRIPGPISSIPDPGSRVDKIQDPDTHQKYF